MVGAKKVIVDGFGNAHHAALIAHRLHIAAYLVAGVHGVVAAVIKEITDVVFFKYFQDTLIVCIVLFRICNFVTARAKFGRRSVQQKLQLGRVLLIHYIELIIQDSLYTVGGAVNFSDFLSVKGSADDAVGAGVYHGGGASGLAENAGTDKLFRHIFSSKFFSIFIRFVKTAY